MHQQVDSLHLNCRHKCLSDIDNMEIDASISLITTSPFGGRTEPQTIQGRKLDWLPRPPWKHNIQWTVNGLYLYSFFIVFRPLKAYSFMLICFRFKELTIHTHARTDGAAFRSNILNSQTLLRMLSSEAAGFQHRSFRNTAVSVAVVAEWDWFPVL